MNDFTRNRAGIVHPNVLVAKRELERQEMDRLRRLSEVRPSRTTKAGAVTPSRGTAPRPLQRAVASRPASRPASAAVHASASPEADATRDTPQRVQRPKSASSAGSYSARQNRKDQDAVPRLLGLVSEDRKVENDSCDPAKVASKPGEEGAKAAQESSLPAGSPAGPHRQVQQVGPEKRKSASGGQSLDVRLLEEAATGWKAKQRASQRGRPWV
mmetsp:Transcript_73381/g.174833  ORF Transcript_73381/g.174833 Transcript_73381/m.174833 type:complete len:214 (+) Transcript_73381:21-662(+)